MQNFTADIKKKSSLEHKHSENCLTFEKYMKIFGVFQVFAKGKLFFE